MQGLIVVLKWSQPAKREQRRVREWQVPLVKVRTTCVVDGLSQGKRQNDPRACHTWSARLINMAQ